MRDARKFSAAVLLFSAVSFAHAHEFWLEPETYQKDELSPLRVGIRVGEHFEGKPVKRDASRIIQFTARVSEYSTKVTGLDGQDVNFVRFDHPGLGIIAYQSNHKFIELPGDKFEAYLREEGLDHIVELRKQRGQSDKPGKEIYSRSAKSLIRLVGDTEGMDQSVGLRLELIAGKNPYNMKPGDELPIRLLFDGKPLPDARIKAVHGTSSGDPVTARTDRMGFARIKLNSAGTWLVTSIHMQEAPNDSEADWESFWASSTFQVP
jgi:uncharacterized GH25 family protein